MDFSFIHVSDIHLGRPFSGLSKYSFDEKLNELYKNAVERAFKNIVNFALIKNVDFVFIAGDTFDSDEQDFSSKLVLKEALKKLADADIDVFLICGNHDPVSSYSKNTFSYDSNSKIKIIGLNTPRYQDFDLYNKSGNKVACLHALSFTDDKMLENPLDYFSPPSNENIFNIGLLHCDLNADSTSPYAPCNITDLKNLKYDYWALGHIHIPTSAEFNIQYAGTSQGRNTKETGVHGIRYVQVENNRIVKNTFVSTDIIRFEDMSLDVSSLNDATEIPNVLDEELNNLINKDVNSCELFLVRLNLKGCVKFFHDINDELENIIVERIKINFNGKIYISQITNETIPFIDETILNEDDGIAGELYKTAINQEIIKEKYFELKTKYKNFIDSCNFLPQDYKYFYETIVQKAKDECINLCSSIYDIDSKED